MASSPPGSPSGLPQRPRSALIRPAPRSTSRMSTNSKTGGSRASDEDGKTSVKVAVRVRPPLRAGDPGYELIPQRFQRSMVQNTSPTSLAIESPQGRKLFVFDRVFGEDVDQQGIWDYLADSVSAFVQGYNVSMLAYGQSGAGKSYTMGTAGPAEQENYESMGVIPRAATSLFEKLEGSSPPKSNRNSMSGLRSPSRYSMHSSKGGSDKTWKLKATYVEIYNEHLRDLLIPDTVPTHERAQVAIRQDVKGNIILTGLRQVDINSVDDLMNALSFGSSIRQTDSTAINAKSSRSHAVFSLNLVQRTSKPQTSTAEKRFSVPLEAMTSGETMVTIDSKFHFVDLAGSERLKNTGAQGERAKEGISINAGLASLGKVISQLSSRQAGSHVSYRDSMLTRLLQDSLGGNAITYMIACVTPAEFHLSETLNTVQYAQRARAIQSKPRIQQVSDESDKQALIDRLKAEVAFLREQIRSTERGTERRSALTERPERQNEREIELQNTLLDIQENYSSLSQRHAKLISEIAKAREGEREENKELEHLEDSATERLKRSNSFAEAVEQVVLEYEKTIQSLEQSLSSTRGSLSTTEATLLEKETKCAYIETVNLQLQNRIQKLMDRESSTESYLKDLEAKLDSHASGEEKNSTIVTELRKELSRVRESEANCEDYISTLEERLAEADQDAELMQREIERLEHVIERQRSLGKLDNLLYELDHIQNNGKPESEAPTVNGVKDSAAHARKPSLISRRSKKNGINGELSRMEDVESIKESNENGEKRTAEEGPVDNGESIEEELEDIPEETDKAEEALQSPAQTKFMNDKFENVTQELIDLRVEHETTVTEFEILSAKYEEVLRAMAELQDAMDEAKHPAKRNSILSVASPTTATRPMSFLADARVVELRDSNNYSSSRSLSSELSSAGESAGNMEPSDVDTAAKNSEAGDVVEDDDQASAEDVEVEKNGDESALMTDVEDLKRIALEKDEAEKDLRIKLAQLEEEHMETLDLVEELKTEISKVKHNAPASPRSATPVIRRKSSQNVMIIDRAHRSFAALRNIATENFEGSPDTMQNFELNLNAAMHELHARSERVQELEADISSVKKEMETKMTIISGLTRERSSLQNTSPMEMSMVSSMQEQLMQSETQIRILQESHSAREKELRDEIASLQVSIGENAKNRETELEAADGQSQLLNSQNEKISHLQAEIETWESKHQAALETMQSSEQKLLATISDLESRIAETSNNDSVVEDLKKALEEHKQSVSLNSSRIAELEESHSAATAELEEAIRARDANMSVIDEHKNAIQQLEQQIASHEGLVKSHEEQLNTLHAEHARAIEDTKASIQAQHDERILHLTKEHAESIQALEAELADAREELLGLAAQVGNGLGRDVSVDKLPNLIAELVGQQKILASEKTKNSEFQRHIVDLSTINDTVMSELESAKKGITALISQSSSTNLTSAASVSEHLTVLKKEMQDLETRNKKNSRLVEELEDQLASNFDQHQIANNRLSSLQSERNQQLEEARTAAIRAQAELESMREAYNALQAKYDEIVADPSSPKRTNSMNSNLRKSASVASLPSPPPAIPLPPLPGSISNSMSPPPTNGPIPAQSRPMSNDLALAQIHEDQEARIRTIEKHLFAEKQLTATLEEALTDLERQSNKVKADCDAWRRRATELETEVRELKERPAKEERWSVHAVEEERKKRLDAEMARRQLEERMNTINKKKKKSSLNCF